MTYLYTDGACSGNPGPGACAYILISDVTIKNTKSFIKTTNNRMELLAVILGLENEHCEKDVTVISDSLYVVNSINKGWLDIWCQKGIESRPNYDLWIRLLPQLKTKNVQFLWCRAHNNDSHNNEADKLAKRAVHNIDKEEDAV